MMGKVIMSGIVPELEVSVAGIKANTLAVGASVFLMENGNPVEYLVVNQGIPSGSSLYDTSCNGTWLLRKEVYDNYNWAWNESSRDPEAYDYQNSGIPAYLNGDFYSVFGEVEKATIKQVKIPYYQGIGGEGAVVSGSKGLETKVFLLGGYELGLTNSTSTGTSTTVPVDGAKLDYFGEGNTTGSADAKKRVAYGIDPTLDLYTELFWWTRSPGANSSEIVWQVDPDGVFFPNSFYSYGSYYGVRPAIVLPGTAIFEEETLLLKGVS